MRKRALSKEIFDKVVAFIALIILSPLFLIVAVLIKIDSKGPVFFMQERVGKNGKIFKTFKFRTMVVGADEKTKGIYIDKENPYVTKIGKFLRRSGIDELPQVINVLKCDMSFVGPRPTLEYQINPNKFFDYLAAGKPIISNVGGWTKEIIEKNCLGLVVRAGDPEALAYAMLKMSNIGLNEIREMGLRSRKVAEEYFSRMKLAEKLESVLLESFE